MAEKTRLDPTAKVNVGELQTGDYLSETQYYKVLSRKQGGIEVENERGFKFNISEPIIQEGCYSSNQFTDEEKVTQTELADILQNAGDSVFSINFNKKTKPEDVLAELKKLPKKEFTVKAMKTAIAGEARTMVAHRVSSEPSLGRTQVVDLETEIGGRRLRLIDHRTINWIVLKNVRYVLKRARK